MNASASGAGANSTSIPHLLPAGISIDEYLGALQIGVCFNVFLFVVLTLQLYYYFEHHRSDGRYIKGLIAMAWVLELTRTIAMFYLQYHLSVTSFATLAFLNFHSWSVQALMLLCTIIDLVAQAFYALWIKTLAKNWYIPSLCLFLAGAQVLLLISLAVLSPRHSMIELIVGKFRPILITALSCSFMMDLVTSASLWKYLCRAEGKISTRRYMLLSVRVITLLLGVVNIACLVASPDNCRSLCLTVGLNTLFSAQTYGWLSLVFVDKSK